MKKVYLFAASLMLTAGAMAQTNLGFETWTTGNPDGWATRNGLITQANTAVPGSVTIGGTPATVSVTQGVVGAPEGASFAKVQSFSLNGLSGAGVPDGIYGGFVDQNVQTTNKYGGIAYQYKVTINGTDAVGGFVNATNQGNTVAQGYKMYTATTAGWVKDTIYLNSYTSAPDTIEILFGASFGTLISGVGAPTPSQDGAIIEVDDVQFLPILLPADPATNIIASDVSNNGDGTDLKVTFDAAADETTVSEYRLFVIKYGYTANNWNTLPVGSYEVVTPTGASNYSHTFTAASICLGVSGGSISPYVIAEDSIMDVFVLSVADGTNATANQIAGPDSTVLKSSHVGIKNLSLANNEVRVYPNPARNMVNFAFENNNIATEVRVFNTTGQLVNSVPVSIITSVDLNNVDSGMYIYQIIGNNNEIIKTDKFQVVK